MVPDSVAAGHAVENGRPRRTKADVERAPAKPAPVEVRPDPIPQALKARPQWVNWRWERPEDRWTKIPADPRTGRAARTNDPATWGTFAEALARHRAGKADGVGYVFSADDPFAGIDLDDCRDPDAGTIDPWALDALSELASYADISPSGTGLKVFVEARLPGGGRKVGNIEMYDRGRFFTVTGHRLEGPPGSIEPRQSEAKRLYSRLVAEKTSGGLWKGRVSNGASITDRAVAYLAKLPPAVSGQGGHDATLTAARAVVYGFDLGAEVGFTLLAQHYNPRCEPPWSEKELRHKCQEADTVAFGKERGWLLKGDAPRVSACPAPRKPTLRPVPGFEPFPLSALPPVLGDYVDAAARARDCDAALVALPALATVAGCIGNSRALSLKRGWSEPPILWALTVALSGAGKSPAFDAAIGPLSEIQMAAVEQRERRQEEHEKAQRERKEKRRGERGPEPEEPEPEACYVTSEATIEGMACLLRDNPRGLLLASPELDSWFQGFTRYKKAGGTDRPHWLELHRAGTLRIHRVSRPPLSVRRCCCSITGTIQPGILSAALDSEALAAGLGARFLMAMPPRRQRRWTEAEVCEDLASRYGKLLRDLLALPPDAASTYRPHFLSLASAAKLVFVEWVNRWGARQYAAQDAEAAALAKLEGYAARLALVHHVVAHVASGAQDVRPVGDRSVLAGIQLAEWFAAEALRVYAVLRESSGERSRRELAEWIAARGGTTTAKAVQENLRSRYPDSDDARAALDELAQAGAGVWVDSPTGPKGGRPTRHFQLSAHETTKPRNHTPAGDGPDDSPQAVAGEEETNGGRNGAPAGNGGFRGFVGADRPNGVHEHGDAWEGDAAAF